MTAQSLQFARTSYYHNNVNCQGIFTVNRRKTENKIILDCESHKSSANIVLLTSTFRNSYLRGQTIFIRILSAATNGFLKQQQKNRKKEKHCIKHCKSLNLQFCEKNRYYLLYIFTNKRVHDDVHHPRGWSMTVTIYVGNYNYKQLKSWHKYCFNKNMKDWYCKT